MRVKVREREVVGEWEEERDGWRENERERERESKATHTHTCMKPSKFGKFLPYLRPNVPFVISQSEIKYPHNVTTHILAHELPLSISLSLSLSLLPPPLTQPHTNDKMLKSATGACTKHEKNFLNIMQSHMLMSV